MHPMGHLGFWGECLEMREIIFMKDVFRWVFLKDLLPTPTNIAQNVAPLM